MRLPFRFCGHLFEALGSGALFWPSENTLLVADLHLGRPERMARRASVLIPPQGDGETLSLLAAAMEETRAERVISLGDAFDDPAGVTALLPPDASALQGLAGRAEWLWIAGNHEGAHDPGFGTVRSEAEIAGIGLRHIAGAGPEPDISGHFHPKARIAGRARPAFLVGARHVILPAFGVYTGGMEWPRAPLPGLVGQGLGIMTGAAPRAFPLR